MTAARASELITHLRTRGARVWADNGRVCYAAPPGIIQPADVEGLRGLKAEILAVLDQQAKFTAPEKLRRSDRTRTDPVPLTFTQQWLWKLYDLERRDSMRSVASAMRLSGPLDLGSLREALGDLIRRHESLRTRFVSIDGAPRQLIEDPQGCALRLIDLPERQTVDNARHLSEQFVQERYSVTTDPLLAALLIKVSTDDHVLVVAMDHLISDGMSLGIVWRDLWALYGQRVRSLPAALPPLPLQFPDYAIWEQEMQKSRAVAHDPYWKERLDGAERVRLPYRGVVSKASRANWASSRIAFCEELSAKLREFSRREATTLAMTAFTVYVALVLRLYERASIVMSFLAAGRGYPGTEDVIGFFGHPLYLRLTLGAADGFRDLLGQVVREYCGAYERDDFARLPISLPAPAFVGNPAFSWIPREIDRPALAPIPSPSEKDFLRIEPFELEIVLRDDLQWDAEPRLDLADSPEGIVGTVRYRADSIALTTIERLQRNLDLFARVMVSDPHRRVADLRCER